ncbi:MAG: PIN domain-containing protein [bacterium]|nr:PIN domain-containing protein [bacterium]
MKSWLLDTGPLVAYLDAKDRFHTEVAHCLDAFSGQLHTTSAVITEAMHFVAASPEGPRVLVEFVTASDLEVHDFAQPDDLGRAVELMEKYPDTPMDYADATLVLLAERLNVPDIVTLDRRGFAVFRIHRNKPFRLILDHS